MGRKSKLGRQKNSVQNTRYKAEGRRRKNKIRKLIKHLIAYPEDAQAEASLVKISKGQTGVAHGKRWVWRTKAPKVKGGEPYRYRERLVK